ncbi:MAG: hypothetical protein IKV34_03465, partial [Clostridia bacterium]|nr:hypothetical protein [Clostridia bacterium]
FEVFSMLGQKPLGIIPDDDSLSFCFLGESVKNMPSDTAFEMIATNLHEGTEYMYDCLSRYSGFFGNIRRKIKRKA